MDRDSHFISNIYFVFVCMYSYGTIFVRWKGRIDRKEEEGVETNG